MKNVRMIFFDIDGTLLDHKGAEAEGIKAFYESNVFDKLCNFESFKQAWVKYSDKNFNKFLNKECNFEEQRAMRIIDVYNEFNKKIEYKEALGKFGDYLIAYERAWKAYDDVINCLKSLKGYKIGIISNGDYNQQIEKLKRMNIYTCFCDVVAAGEVGYAKPDSKIFEIACERNNIGINEACYVGDNIKTDIVPAEAIGMKAVLIDRNKSNSVEGTINRIYSLNDLKMFIEG